MTTLSKPVLKFLLTTYPCFSCHKQEVDERRGFKSWSQQDTDWNVCFDFSSEGACVSSLLTRMSWETSQAPKPLTLENLKSNLPIMCELKYWGLHVVSWLLWVNWKITIICYGVWWSCVIKFYIKTILRVFCAVRAITAYPLLKQHFSDVALHAGIETEETTPGWLPWGNSDGAYCMGAQGSVCVYGHVFSCVFPRENIKLGI